MLVFSHARGAPSLLTTLLLLDYDSCPFLRQSHADIPLFCLRWFKPGLTVFKFIIKYVYLGVLLSKVVFSLRKILLVMQFFFSFTMNGEHKSEFLMKAIKCFHSISLGIEIVGDFFLGLFYLQDFL